MNYLIAYITTLIKKKKKKKKRDLNPQPVVSDSSLISS